MRLLTILNEIEITKGECKGSSDSKVNKIKNPPLFSHRHTPDCEPASFMITFQKEAARGKSEQIAPRILVRFLAQTHFGGATLRTNLGANLGANLRASLGVDLRADQGADLGADHGANLRVNFRVNNDALCQRQFW